MCERVYGVNNTSDGESTRKRERVLPGCALAPAFLVLSHKLKSVSSSCRLLTRENEKLIIGRLTVFRSPCIIDSVLAVVLFCKAEQERPYKGSVAQCPRLLLSCRSSDSRAASWETGTDRVIADPHCLNLLESRPTSLCLVGFFIGHSPHCDSGREFDPDEAGSYHGQATWPYLQS